MGGGDTTAGSACAAQWDRAYEEGIAGDGSDRELLATLRRCPDYPTWQREMDRVGGQSPNTLRAGCMVEPLTRVCQDAADRGAL